VVGFKAGLTAAGIRDALGAAEPDIGVLFADMAHTNGEVIDAAKLFQPRVEVELAFVMGAVPAEPTVAAVLAATSHLVAAIEVVDSRIADWRVDLVDTVADNASSAAFALGADRLPTGRVDTAALTATLVINGHHVASGTSDSVLGDPAAAAAWIAGSVSRLHTPLEPGHVLLTGSFTTPTTIAPGDEVVAHLSGFSPLTIRFG